MREVGRWLDITMAAVGTLGHGVPMLPPSWLWYTRKEHVCAWACKAVGWAGTYARNRGVGWVRIRLPPLAHVASTGSGDKSQHAYPLGGFGVHPELCMSVWRTQRGGWTGACARKRGVG
jgi:hypothetical protein